MRAVSCPVRILGHTALGCESTRVVLTIQRRVHPAAWPQPDCSGGQMHSRLSSSRSFVFHRSGLRRGRRLLCPLLTSPRYSASVAKRPASMFRSTGEISQGKTRYLHCMDAGFTKCTRLPQMEDAARTCPLVPNASRLISGFCSSPRSFGLGFPATRMARGVQAGKSSALANPAFTLQTPPRGDALAIG